MIHKKSKKKCNLDTFNAYAKGTRISRLRAQISANVLSPSHIQHASVNDCARTPTNLQACNRFHEWRHGLENADQQWVGILWEIAPVYETTFWIQFQVRFSSSRRYFLWDIISFTCQEKNCPFELGKRCKAMSQSFWIPLTQVFNYLI